MPPSATRHASHNHGYKGTVLLEPQMRYWSIPLNTLHWTTEWSRWRAYLPAVLAVFYKLIICIDILLQVTLTSRGDNIRTILPRITAFLACRYRPCVLHSMMYLSHHPLPFPKFSIFRQGQVRCKPGYQLRSNRRSFWGSLLLLLTSTMTIDQYGNEI